MDLKQRTISGVRWVTLTGIVQRLLGFAAIVVLARVLDPAEFGLFALAFIAIGALSLFQDLGVETALIQRKGDERIAADTAFWLIPLMSGVLFGLTQLCAPLFASWVGDDQLIPIVRWLGVIFLVNSLGRVPLALLSKRTEFAKRSWAQMSGEVVYAVVAVALALCGWKIWSLVAGYLAKVVVTNGLAWMFVNFKPTFGFDRVVARQMLQIGGFLVASNILWFIKTNVGALWIGKLLGVTALGYYTIAFGIANFLSTYIFGRMNHVMFPVLARMQDNRAEVIGAYLKYLKYVAIVALPVGIGLLLVAEPFLHVVYGAKWLPAAPALRILAIAGVMGVLSQPGSSVFYAHGASRRVFTVGLVSAGTLLGLIVPLTAHWGVVGTAVAVLISNCLGFLASVWGVRRVLGVRLVEVGRVLGASVMGGVALSAIVLLLRDAVPLLVGWSFSPLSHLFVLVFSGALTYLLYLIVMEKSFLADVRDFLR